MSPLVSAIAAGNCVILKPSELSSVTLELGGKSRVIIERSYDLKKAAKKIAWGKLINAGQTCVNKSFGRLQH